MPPDPVVTPAAVTTPAVVAKPAAAPLDPGGVKPAAADSAALAAGSPPAPAKAADKAAVAREAFRLREARRDVGKQVAALQEQHTKALADMKAQLDELAVGQKSWQEERKAFLADPIEWAQKNGHKAEDAIRGYVAKGTPEAAIEAARKEAAEARASADELKKLREQDKVDREKEREDGQKQAKAAAEQGACKAFTRSVTADAKKYPHINAMYEPAEIEAKAAEFQRLAAAEEWTDAGGNKHVGKAYPFDDVANAFERSAKAAYEKKQARIAELTSSPDEEPGPALGIQKKLVPGNGRREGTNGPDAERAPKPKPKPRTLTREEQAKEDMALLRKAFEQDAKARAAH